MTWGWDLERLLLTISGVLGNKYSITNESRTKTARLFFAQGCEMEAMLMEEEDRTLVTGTEQTSVQ